LLCDKNTTKRGERPMKKSFIVIAILLAMVVTLSLAKNTIIKVVVEKGVEAVTGLPLRMGGFDAGLIKTRVNINALKLYNPKDFEDRIMIDMPNVYVDYNLPAILKGKVHLYDMKIDLKEFVVVKNKDGKLNLDSLTVVQAQKEGKKPQEKVEMQIDNLGLKIGKVIYKDYSARGKPSVREFNVNINEKYSNIKDPYSLVSLIVVRALMNTAIASLTNFDLGGLSNTVSDTLSHATKLATDTTAKATKIVGDTSKTVTDAAGKLTEAFSFPFGEKKE
jgi:hypothetical protein